VRRRRDDAVSLMVRRLARQMEDNTDFHMPYNIEAVLRSSVPTPLNDHLIKRVS